MATSGFGLAYVGPISNYANFFGVRDWFSRGQGLEHGDAKEDISASKIQALWRGVALRRALPNVVSLLWTGNLVKSARSKMSTRAVSKVYIRMRNKKIDELHEEVDRHSGVTSLLYRNRLKDELEVHLSSQRHRLRATLLIQSWFRSVLTRNFRRKSKRGRLLGKRAVSTFGMPQPLSDTESDVPSSSSDFLGTTLLSSNRSTANTVHTDRGRWREGKCQKPTIFNLENSSKEDSGVVAFLGGAMSSLSSRFSYSTESVTTTTRHHLYPDSNVPRINLPGARIVRTPRRVVIYFSDTGAGHYASAKALKAALHHVYGNKVRVDIVDFIRTGMTTVFSKMPEAYQVLGNWPSMYKTLWEVGYGNDRWENTNFFTMMWYLNKDAVLTQLSELVQGGIDLIVSVHPLVNHLVTRGLRVVFGDKKPTVQVATVVTDLGSAHLSWFDPLVDALFVPRRELWGLAQKHLVPKDKIHMHGLPVRQGFWTSESKENIKEIKNELLDGLCPTDSDAHIVLVMGGGEGFGNIVEIAIAIGTRLPAIRVATHLVVLCGRNEVAQEKLENHLWLQRNVSIFGFVANIDMYMDVADILVTKAGPGSIAEAMIKGLPCLLTSSIPGQEEGNIDYVVKGGAGKYVPETEPETIADTVLHWIQDREKLKFMSANARRLGRPRATVEIASSIGAKLLNLTSIEDKQRHGP